MSAMLIKSRAHKPLERANVCAGWSPYGVGGMPQNGPCVVLTIGGYRLIIHELAWNELLVEQAKLIRENPARG